MANLRKAEMFKAAESDHLPVFLWQAFECLQQERLFFLLTDDGTGRWSRGHQHLFRKRNFALRIPFSCRVVGADDAIDFTEQDAAQPSTQLRIGITSKLREAPLSFQKGLLDHIGSPCLGAQNGRQFPLGDREEVLAIAFQ